MPCSSILVLSPITSMNMTPSAASTAWIIPNELPSPMPKMTSAPSAMTCLGDPLAARGVRVAGLADLGEPDLDVRVLRAGPATKPPAMLVPVRVVGGDHDPEVAALARLRGEHAGEVGALLARCARRWPRLRHVRLGVVPDELRDAGLRGDVGSGRVVAGGLGDDELGAAGGRELAQDRRDVLIAGAVGDLDLDPEVAGDLLGRLDRLLVPAVVGALLRRHDRELRDRRFGPMRSSRRPRRRRCRKRRRGRR